MKLFGLNQFCGIRKRGSHVFFAALVFAENPLTSHPACQSAHDARHRDTSPADDWLAMLDLWIDYNSIVHFGLSRSNDTTI